MKETFKGAIGTNMDPIAVEYDCHGSRVSKTFEDAWEARRFFAEKLKVGKNPKVKKAEE